MEMKFEKTGEILSENSREIFIRITESESEILDISVKMSGGRIELFDFNGDEIFQDGSGDDDYCDDWERYYQLTLTLIGKSDVENLTECYGFCWDVDIIRESFREWFSNHPEFLTDNIREFIK